MHNVLVNVFTRREQLLHALRTGDGLAPLVWRMALGSVLCATLYGAVLGAQVGGWQVLASPVKLPLILVGTCGLCVTALYVLFALAGARLHWLQVCGLSLCAVAASSLTMLALLPITAFWTLSFGGERSPVMAVHSAAFFLAGLVGTRFGREMTACLLQETRYLRVMTAWMWIYGLVAQQMAWIFRPHFNATSVFMRPLQSGGSALESWARMLLEALRHGVS
jgi:hypothetical protein